VRSGLVSNWLCDNVKRGDTLRVLPPDGRFVVPADRRGNLFLFAAGSGITPIYSIAGSALATSERAVRLVAVDRTEEEAIFQDRLEHLREQHGRRFKVVHRIGRREGRIDARDVHAYCNGVTNGLFFVCGPWGFMDIVEEALLDMGVDPERVFVERFASPTKRASSSSAIDERQGRSTGPCEVTLDVFGKRFVIPCERDQTITRAAFDAAVDVPSSCEEGFCGSCTARLVGGDVDVESDVALTRGQKKRGYVLACQARPRSTRVTLRFDR
jgi:3-ketosteroid 9alpha-monooxygenase subunit B